MECLAYLLCWKWDCEIATTVSLLLRGCACGPKPHVLQLCLKNVSLDLLLEKVRSSRTLGIISSAVTVCVERVCPCPKLLWKLLLLRDLSCILYRRVVQENYLGTSDLLHGSVW